MALRFWLSLLVMCACSWSAFAEPTAHARLEHLDRSYVLNGDLTWVETITADTQVLTQRGLREHERSSYTFYPPAQSLDLVEAWVEQPDGTRLPVAESARFTRPSEAAQNAPGFTGAMTTTILYPQLREGSRTHVVWRLTQNTPALLGFNVQALPPLDTPVGVAVIRIDSPPDVTLHWASRGGFAVSERIEAGRHLITARIADTHAEEPERNMVDASDFAPIFLATSLPDMNEMGAIYYRQSRSKAVVTPEIAALAARVAAGQGGLAAARAVYDWVAANIRYVAVYMDPNDGWVPHAASAVLRNGYGDCKDHVVLMQAMLAALGIRAEAALIEQGSRTRDLPLWVPQFNHAIVYLPDFGRFINPTNPYARFDSLDRLLAGRTAVLATEHGEIAHTPPALPQDNTYGMESHVVIADDGGIEGNTVIAPAANLESAARSAIAQAASPRDLAERLLAATPEGGFGSLASFDPRDLTRPFQITGTWHSPHGVTFDAREAFITVPVGLDLDPVERLRTLLSDGTPRRHPLLTAAGDFHWTTTLTLPAGVVFVRLPHDVDFANEAGSYAAGYERTGDEVRVVRRLVVNRARFEAPEVRDLEALVYTALDDSRAVLGLARAEASSVPADARVR